MMSFAKFSWVLVLASFAGARAAAPKADKEMKSDRIISVRIDRILGEEKMKSASLLVRDGGTARIEEPAGADGAPGSFFEVQSKIGEDSKIFMAFKVGRIVNGAKIIDAQPQIVTTSGQEAVLVQKNNDGKPDIELRAMPKILD